MDRIFIEREIKTPKVDFNPETGELLLEGVSVPENTVDFYHPLVYWLQKYVESNKDTEFNIKLEYFNTSTSVILLNMFRALSSLGREKLKINWYYEEDDVEMEEAGTDYGNMIDIPFNIIKVDSFD